MAPVKIHSAQYRTVEQKLLGVAKHPSNLPRTC
jgi:hypothetical protein